MSGLDIPILHVAQAIQLCNSLLRELPLEVEGEISSYSVARGQFIFFDLKDEEVEARLACFMLVNQLQTPLENGMRVLISGTPGLYQKNGAFRLTVNRIQPRGEGSLQRSFALLRSKLENEGLFSQERKRSLPRFVQEVGIISSAGAAGFGDFVKIAQERLPGILFRHVDVSVQGERAELEICTAFDRLNSYYSLDAIVLVRGGGSIEDLHAFNSEVVARAIIRSKVPVVVGVGHERDLTIADLVADVRAATPSNAAQLLLPTEDEVRKLVLTLRATIRQRLRQTLTEIRYRVKSLAEAGRSRLRLQINDRRQRVQAVYQTIITISPQATLKRGYTLSFDMAGKPLISSQGLLPGAFMQTYFVDGSVKSIIIDDEAV